LPGGVDPLDFRDRTRRLGNFSFNPCGQFLNLNEKVLSALCFILWMRIFVTTSDYYNPLLAGFCHLFNRNWPGVQPVTILCYERPDAALPGNFSVHSLGAAADFGGEVQEWSPGRRGRKFQEPYPNPRWTDSLRPFFESLPEEPFILLQVDYYLHLPVELGKIEILWKYLAREDVVKIDLARDRAFFPHESYAREEGMEIVVSSQTAPYRTSLLPAIWKRDYFLKLLKPGRSPWTFETIGMTEILNDGKSILGVDQPVFGPVPYLNVYYSGKVNWQQLGQLDPETLQDMTRRGMIGVGWNGWVERQ